MRRRLQAGVELQCQRLSLSSRYVAISSTARSSSGAARLITWKSPGSSPSRAQCGRLGPPARQAFLTITSFYIVLYHIMTCKHTDCSSRRQGFLQNLSFFAWQQGRLLESFPATAPGARPRRWQAAQRHYRDACSWFTHCDYDFEEFATCSTLSVDPEFISELWKAPHLPTLSSHTVGEERT